MDYLEENEGKSTMLAQFYEYHRNCKKNGFGGRWREMRYLYAF